jgi:YHS domain-containing protein
MMVNEKTAPSLEYKGKTYYFMDSTHRDMFKKDPEKYLTNQENQSH